MLTQMMLGQYRFCIERSTYTALSDSRQWRWQAQERINAPPVYQYTGPGERTVNLTGTVYPGKFGDADEIERMTKEAGSGKPLLLVAGTGAVLGYWCITQAGGEHTLTDGAGIPARIGFTLAITFYGEADAVFNAGQLIPMDAESLINTFL